MRVRLWCGPDRDQQSRQRTTAFSVRARLPVITVNTSKTDYCSSKGQRLTNSECTMENRGECTCKATGRVDEGSNDSGNLPERQATSTSDTRKRKERNKREESKKERETKINNNTTQPNHRQRTWFAKGKDSVGSARHALYTDGSWRGAVR
jgi:hypothetical protein